MPTPSLHLTGFTFAELFQSEGLERLDQTFLSSLDNKLLHLILAYREGSREFSTLEISELLLSAAVELEKFLITLFDIEHAAVLAKAQTVSHNPVAAFKKFFVLRRAKKLLSNGSHLASFAELNNWLTNELNKLPLQTNDKELAVGLLANQFLANPDAFVPEIEKLTEWCVQAINTPEGQQEVSQWTSFHLPERIDYDHLIECAPVKDDKLNRLASSNTLRLREGFKLTDKRMNAREAQDEVNYCIYCHDHDGDFCSKGFPQKKADPTLGLKKNPLNITMTGCPLEEKISEMQLLKRDGYTLAALAMVMVDNPMCPVTGHRICNDCMKACVYQKQDPVDIPQVETRVLTDVLNLPWGVEIYDLLTRWNPLRQKQWIMKPYNGLKVMIAGMGPAGFTLAHHLLLEGFAVVGFDGLKIEPLPETLINQPIYQFNSLTESLDERLMAGFGGVAEYGITVRWDKNFLKLIYLSLMRKPYFQVFGNVRFGGTVTVDDAWEMGFDHFVVAVGAGLPKALSIPNSLAPGMRQANDFLMALQLGSAAKASSLTNLQVRLPAVIVGSGLTGVDTATEVQAYYIAQVEKILFRYETLSKEYGENIITNQLDEASLAILREFLTHGKAVKQERERAIANQEQPNFIKLIREWGGVTIVYRRTMQESPAYILNHEELQKGLEEGIYYLEALEPAAVQLDAFGHSQTLVCHRRIRINENEWKTTPEEVHIPARAIFVATGTQPNTAYEFEHRGTFSRVGLQYQHYEDNDGELTTAPGVTHCKDPQFGPFTSYQKNDHRVSLIGDTHPVFHGSVVKAIASGMQTYPKILSVLKNKLGNLGDKNEYHAFAEKMTHLFTAIVTQTKHCTDNVIELIIQAPLAAKNFKPGQFYRLQNYETLASRINNTTLQMEPLALVAAGCDPKLGTLKFIIIEKGTSSKLCKLLRAGDPVALMGPTGVRAKIPTQKETILIIGSQMSLPLLQAYGLALRHANNRVIYLGNFKTKQDVYCLDDIENSANVVIWNMQSKDLIKARRPEDYSAHGDYIQTLLRYHTGQLDPNKTQPEIPLSDVDRIYLVGDSQFLRHFQQARQTDLKTVFVKDPIVHGSVFSTMQCMLKGVCAQCLQWQIDPETGQRTKAIFACSWPEQPLELIDFDNIEERQIQNRLQEQLTNLWVDHILQKPMSSSTR